MIVNDMSEINIDAAIVKSEVALNRSDEELVEMSNSLICCTWREDELLKGRHYWTTLSDPFPEWGKN